VFAKLFDQCHCRQPGVVIRARLVRYFDGALKRSTRFLMLPEACQRRCVRRQGFGEQSVFISTLKDADSRVGSLFGFCIASLFKKGASASIFNLCRAALVLETEEQPMCAIKMLVRFAEAVFGQQEKAQVVFDARSVADVSGLLEVKAGGGVFD
jgi:hypothetical protein